MALRRDPKTGNVIGISGVASVPKQAAEFLRTGLPSTPVFLSTSEVELDAAASFYSDKLMKAGISGVLIEKRPGCFYLVRRGR